MSFGTFVQPKPKFDGKFIHETSLDMQTYSAITPIPHEHAIIAYLIHLLS